MEDSDKGLEYFRGLSYDVVVRKRSNRFALFISELGILTEDESLEKAYQKVESEKERHFQKVVELGLQDEIVEPRKQIAGRAVRTTSQGGFVSDVASFVVKLTIVFLACGVVLYVASDHLGAIKNISLRQIASDNASNILNEINNIPPEKIEKARLKVRTALAKLKPILSEFKVLIPDEFRLQNEAKPKR